MSDTPLEVHFHGVDRSEAVETRIAEKLRTIEKHFERLTHCRVSIELPHHKQGKSRIFVIKLEIGVPGHQNIVVSSESEDDHAHEDIQIAIRDAFEKARRQADELSKRIKTAARQERGRRRPAPDSAGEA